MWFLLCLHRHVEHAHPRPHPYTLHPHIHTYPRIEPFYFCFWVLYYDANINKWRIIQFGQAWSETKQNSNKINTRKTKLVLFLRNVARQFLDRISQWSGTHQLGWLSDQQPQESTVSAFSALGLQTHNYGHVGIKLGPSYFACKHFISPAPQNLVFLAESTTFPVYS